MVDIEVGKDMMYFSVENKSKIGTERFGYAKYSFYSQNDIVLVFLGPKRHIL